MTEDVGRHCATDDNDTYHPANSYPRSASEIALPLKGTISESQSGLPQKTDKSYAEVQKLIDDLDFDLSRE